MSITLNSKCFDMITKAKNTREILEIENEKLKKELNELKKSYHIQIAEKQNEKEKAERNEKMLHSVVEAAVGKIGQDFFDNIIIKLSEWLNAECVLIGRMTENERIEAIPLLLDGNISHGFSYDLAGSPCDITTRKGYCSYSENVIDLFPKDQILVDLQAESYIGTALYNKLGDTNGVICAVSREKMEIPPHAHDILKIIGARVSAEIERQKVEKELRDSNKAKDTFFSIIAHDLQNPLNVLTGFADLLMLRFDHLNRETIKKYLQLIQKSTISINNLVSQLLSWSLTQQDMINAQIESIELKNIINSTIDSIECMALEKSIDIQCLVSDSLFVKADKNMLSTVFRNLISNAIKFSHENGKILIYSQQQYAKENKCVITVEDCGVGIDENRLIHLFDISKDTTTHGTNNEKGTGLGLILCKEFIEKLNGNIWVESQVNIGTKFIFSLPV